LGRGIDHTPRQLAPMLEKG